MSSGNGWALAVGLQGLYHPDRHRSLRWGNYLEVNQGRSSSAVERPWSSWSLLQLLPSPVSPPLLQVRPQHQLTWSGAQEQAAKYCLNTGATGMQSCPMDTTLASWLLAEAQLCSQPTSHGDPHCHLVGQGRSVGHHGAIKPGAAHPGSAEPGPGHDTAEALLTVLQA